MLQEPQVPESLNLSASEQNKHIRISPARLESELQCTVCLNPINDCYITRCGHVYCKLCIEETINRHHRCPYCNEELKSFKDDVFKNYHFNTIKKIVEEEIKKENQAYLKKVFYQSQRNQGEIAEQRKLAMLSQKEDKENEEFLMAPIEKKLVQMFEDTLLRYRRYLIDTYTVAKQVEEKKLLYGGQKLSENIKHHKQIAEEIQKEIVGSIPNPVISPQLISHPTSVQIVLTANKKPHKSVLKLAPLSTFSTLLPHLQNVCSQSNIRIDLPVPDKLTINGEVRALDEKLGPLAGRAIRVEGIPIKLNVYCYTNQWEIGKVTNFMHCKTCKVKWICENCSNLCHEGHELVIQLKDHKPDWACCYCATKCDCKAINKNSKIGLK